MGRKKKEQRGGFDEGRVLLETRNPPLRQSSEEPELLFREEERLITARRRSVEPIEVSRHEAEPNRASLIVPIVPNVDSDGPVKGDVVLSNMVLGVSVHRVGKDLRIEIASVPHTEQLALFPEEVTSRSSTSQTQGAS